MGNNCKVREEGRCTFSLSYLDCIILELHELPGLIRVIKVSLLHNK